MAEAKNYIRIPVKGELGLHHGEKVRSVVVSDKDGIKALYSVDKKRVITYIFSVEKKWDVEKAVEWVEKNYRNYLDLEEIGVDQEPEFMKILYKQDGETKGNFNPSSPSFKLDEELYDFTTGMDKVYCLGKVKEIVDTVKDGQYYKFRLKDVVHFKQDTFKVIDVSKSIQAVCGQLLNSPSTSIQAYLFDKGAGSVDEAHKFFEDRKIKYLDYCQCEVQEKNMDTPKEIHSQFTQMELIKVDKEKRTVYGLFLVPDKADHDGDVISKEDIEKVAHGFLADYRTIDEMHKDVISADIVESAIAWEDGLEYYGKKLTKGTWFGAIKVHDKAVWEKVKDGTYKGFSVRISGTREPIEEDKT